MVRPESIILISGAKRTEKYEWLAANDMTTTEWEEITPTSPKYRFKPINAAVESEFNKGWDIKQIMPTNSVGITTSRDAFAFDFERAALEERISDFLNPENTVDVVRARYFGTRGRGDYLPGDNRDWEMAEKRTALQRDTEWPKTIVQSLYRPFDVRSLLYHRDAIDFGRWDVMKHILKDENIAIATTRSVEIGREYEHVFCTKAAMQHHAVSLKEVNYLFPLYLYPSREGEPNSQSEIRNVSPWSEGPHGRRPNLDQVFVRELEHSLGCTFVPDGRGNMVRTVHSAEDDYTSDAATFGPEDIFHYIYAILHAPSYRRRYAEFLEGDFPRVPVTSDSKLFSTLARHGATLVGLHTLDEKEAPALRDLTTSYPIPVLTRLRPAIPAIWLPANRTRCPARLYWQGACTSTVGTPAKE